MYRQLNKYKIIFITILFLGHALVNAGLADEARENLIIDSIRRNISEAYFDFAEKQTKKILHAANDHAMIALELEHSLEWLITIQIMGDTIDCFVFLTDGRNLRIQSVNLDKHVLKAAFHEISRFATGESGFEDFPNEADRKAGYVLRSQSIESGKIKSRVEVGLRLKLTPHLSAIVQTAMAKVEE